MSTTTDRLDTLAALLPATTVGTPAEPVALYELTKATGLSARLVQAAMRKLVDQGRARVFRKGTSWKAAANDADERREEIRRAVYRQLRERESNGSYRLGETLAGLADYEQAHGVDDLTADEVAAWLIAGLPER